MLKYRPTDQTQMVLAVPHITHSTRVIVVEVSRSTMGRSYCWA